MCACSDICVPLAIEAVTYVCMALQVVICVFLAIAADIFECLTIKVTSCVPSHKVAYVGVPDHRGSYICVPANTCGYIYVPDLDIYIFGTIQFYVCIWLAIELNLCVSCHTYGYLHVPVNFFCVLCLNRGA